MKVYCQSCGSGYSYTLDKPKFCGSCGKLYTKATTRTLNRDEEEDEGEGFDTSLSSLEFEFDIRKNKGDKLEDIIGSAAEGEAPFVRGKDSSYSKDTIQEDFLKDAGSIKKS